MKHLLFVILFIISISYIDAQVKYETFESEKLGEARELKILLPRNYDPENKTYPLILVLDADYMFEAVAGNVDYYSYWEDMPASIVVGVNQLNKRYDDCMYSEQNSLPIDTGANFFEFIGMELIPYVEKKYGTGSFKVAIGHSESANFINYYLMKAAPLFQSYVAISPDLAPNMLEYIPDALAKIQTKTFYYLANTDNDPKTIKSMTDALNFDISAMDVEKLVYNFNSFEGPTHYSVPTNAIPVALEKMFKIYQPISKKEYQEVILELEISPTLYLQEKYQAIYDIYGVKKQVLINDFKAISAAIEKNETYDYYEALGKMASENYPDTILGGYYMGRFYEETGEPKKAMRTYQSAYPYKEIAGIDKEELLERANLIKEDFGFN